MRLLCRYAGGLACLVTALALVGCGAGPGSTKQADPVGFKNIEVKQGSTSEISLVNTFSGSDLTYKAKSDKTSVATVKVDNEKDTLTVTAVGPGMTTITVTATDPQERSHPQRFTVTVPQPPVDIPDITSLAEDDTSTISLSDKFSGENCESAGKVTPGRHSKRPPSLVSRLPHTTGRVFSQARLPYPPLHE